MYFTWHRKQPTPAMSRLDYFITTMEIAGWTHQCDIIPGYKSDHSIIVLDFNPIDSQSGRGTWKFNTLLLDDSDFVKKIKDKIDETVTNGNELSADRLWELVKFNIAKEAGKYASLKARDRQKNLDNLIGRLTKLMDDQCTTLTDNTEEQKEINKEIEEIYTQKAKSSTFRSKARWHAEGERNTKFL